MNDHLILNLSTKVGSSNWIRTWNLSVATPACGHYMYHGSPAHFCHCTPPNCSLWQQRTAEVQRGEMLKNCVLPKYLSTLKVLQNPAKSVLLCIHAVTYPGPKNISYFDADLKKQ